MGIRVPLLTSCRVQLARDQQISRPCYDAGCTRRGSWVMAGFQQCQFPAHLTFSRDSVTLADPRWRAALSPRPAAELP